MAETSTCQVRRSWLGSGRDDVLIGDLPGFPDNISTGSDGLIWITQASPRVAALDLARRLTAPLRAVIRRLSPGPQPRPKPTGALGVATDGTLVHELRGEIEGFHLLTGVRERAGKVYFGSLEESAIAVTAVG